MATAFTQQERDSIRERLVEAALRFVSIGASRHATVDEIAREAGISKGAFYGFFENKDQLFFEVVERIHREMYGNAAKVMEENAALSVSQRVQRAIFEVYRVARDRNAIAFIREDVPLMLRRLPREAGRELYRNDEEYIRDLIARGRMRLNASVDVVCTVIRLLLMTLQNRNELGPCYDEAMEYLIRGACMQLVSDDAAGEN